MTRLKKIKQSKTTVEKPDYTNYLIGALVVVLLVVLYFNFFGVPAPLPVGGDLTDDDPAIGPKDAKAVIVEFSDFQCPACKAAQPTVDKVLADFKGKVRFVYRDFPLDQGCNANLPRQLHPFACRASLAADCANEQGKFWEYHDLLFERQPAFDDASLKKYAGQLGLNQAQFDACLDSLKYLDEIKKDIADGTALNIQGTPTFFINSRLMENRTYEDFQKAIESAQ